MKAKKTYLIVCLVILSMMLYAVGIYNDLQLTRVTGYIRLLASLFCLLTIIILLIHAFKGTLHTYKVSLVVLLMFLSLNFVLVMEVVMFEIHKYEISKVEKINTCEKANLQFVKDLKNSSLKYFVFGIAEDQVYSQWLEDQYNLDVYHMGCVVTPSYECYNKHVESYFKLGQNEVFGSFK